MLQKRHKEMVDRKMSLYEVDQKEYYNRIARLSKKLKNCNFSNFACNEIKWLRRLKSVI